MEFIAVFVVGIVVMVLLAWVVQTAARWLARCPKCGGRVRFEDRESDGLYVMIQSCTACPHEQRFVGADR